MRSGMAVPATPGTCPSHSRNAFASGANCGIRTVVLQEIGGFNGQLASCGEEVDFFIRVQLAGHELRYAPDGGHALQAP